MRSIKGTLTEKNLLTSFAGESQARMRYTYFASQAKKEGFEQIAAIFTETAEQEKEHAKRMFKYLEGGMVEITAKFPAGVIGTTMENLRAAAAGEHEEWVDGFLARVMQHEFDHLDGVVYTDHLKGLRRQLMAPKLKQLVKGIFSADYKVKPLRK